MKIPNHDTIGAIATPQGEGALSIIRLSGPDALGVADRVFRGAERILDAPANTVHYGRVVDAGGRTVDETLATVFRAPRSFTGEDSVEFCCHGGMLVTHAVLEAVLVAGARQAEPGEFTRRAFLNGRIDLAQAEAVADLIAATSRRAHAVTLEQLNGKLGERVKAVRTDLVDLCSLLEIDLDFTEEGLEVISKGEIEQRIRETHRSLSAMVESFELGRICREGVSVVLTGKPNAGKSSLFNALLKEDRAIVTPVPGTTRDPLEENITIAGLLFRLTDTAGVREPTNVVEAEGVKRTARRVAAADIVLHVVDASLPDAAEEMHEALSIGDRYAVVAMNKSDLLPVGQSAGPALAGSSVSWRMVLVSSTTGSGLENLRTALVQAVTANRELGEGGVLVTNVRHREALARARDGIRLALESLLGGATNEFIALDVRQAIDSLAEITGEITSDDILNNIFGRFCIGK